MRPIHFTATVTAITRYDPDVATLMFAYAGRRPRFRPGQFVHLALDPYDPASHWPESRIFSIASAPGADILRLTISRQGRFTSRILDTLAVGHTVWCKGPYGELDFRALAPGEPLVLIAGGTGITPFCAYMEDALLQPPPVPAKVTLHYGARTTDLLVYRDLAERWQQSVPGARLFLYAEQDGAEPVRRGRIELDHVVARQPMPAAARYFLSGPKLMIQDFRDRLAAHHAVSADRILIDTWD